jgi:hypothetical protein
MSIADDVSQMTNQPIPKEWQPYAEENGITGTGAALLPRPWNTTTDLLVGAGFDPREWRIDGPINSRRWMRYDQTWLYYYKFNVVAGESPEDVKTHVDELEKVIRRRRRAPSIETGGHDAWAYWASDWQIGKREGDNGTPQTVDRVLESFDLAEAQIKSLRRAGRKMPTGVLFGLGDIVEGCTGFYPGQTFMVDANRR